MTTTNYQPAQRGNVSAEEWAFVCVVIESLNNLPNAPFGIALLRAMLESGLLDCECPPLDHHTAGCVAHQRRKDVIDTTELIMLSLIRGTGHRMRGQS